MAKATKKERYLSDAHPEGVTIAQLKRLNRQAKRNVMEAWFRQNFEDPAERTPYESAEGGYQYIHGGPYEADDVLQNEFDGIVPEDLIAELADELSNECWEWAPVDGSEFDDSDYDHDAEIRGPVRMPDPLDLMPDDFDIAGSPRFTDATGERLKQEVLNAIDRAKAALPKAVGSQIGHNHPPEPIDEGSEQAIATELSSALTEFKQELTAKRPRAAKVKKSVKRIADKKTQLGNLAAIFAHEAAKSAGKSYGKEVGKRLGQATVAAILVALTMLTAAVGEWASHLLIP